MSNKHKLYFNALYMADDCMYDYLFYSKIALDPSKICELRVTPILIFEVTFPYFALENQGHCWESFVLRILIMFWRSENKKNEKKKCCHLTLTAEMAVECCKKSLKECWCNLKSSLQLCFVGFFFGSQPVLYRYSRGQAELLVALM